MGHHDQSFSAAHLCSHLASSLSLFGGLKVRSKADAEIGGASETASETGEETSPMD